ncbi:hypothetical protein ES705_07369 [subsurface metagenome]
MPITQAEFDYLIKLEKRFETSHELVLGPAPLSWERNINAIKTKDTFIFDFYRGSFELSKYTYNKRYRQTIILLRYDANGRHTNPDGATFDGPHVHIYKEGFDDKFAYPVTDIGIDETDGMKAVLEKFLIYRNVKSIPSIQTTMF